MLSIISQKIDGILHSEVIPIDKFLVRPTKLEIIGKDHIIIFDNSPDSMFNLFTIPDGELLQSWGQVGKGPEEYLMIKDGTITYRNSTLRFLDNNDLVIYQLINPDSLRYSKKHPIYSSPEPINGFIAFTDSTFVRDNSFVVNSNPDKEFILFSLGSSSEKAFGEYPETDKVFSNTIEKIQYFMKTPTFNQVSGKLAYFYINQPLLKIYDTKGNILQQLSYKIEHVVENENNDHILYSVVPFSTPNFIYSLYLGDTKNNIFNPDIDFMPEILVWTWDGKLSKRLKLDKSIGAFTVDEENNIIYATDLNGGKFLYKCQIPQNESEIKSLSKKTTTFENKYYKFLLPKDYKLIPDIKQADINNLRKIEKDNITINSNIFYVPDHKEPDECKCSIKTSMLQSDNQSHLNSSLRAGIQSTAVISDTIEEIHRPDSTLMFLRKRQYKSNDPRGSETTIKNAYYFWFDGDNRAFSVSTSCENDTYCMETLDVILNSFEAK